MNGALNIHPKVAGGTLGGTLGILAVWIMSLAHVSVDPTVAGALVTALAALGGWLSPIIKAEEAKLTKP